MQIPNYVLRARRLNTPSDLPPPPPPRSLDDVVQHAWALDAHLRAAKARSFVWGVFFGLLACGALLFSAQRLSGLPARPGAALIHPVRDPALPRAPAVSRAAVAPVAVASRPAAAASRPVAASAPAPQIIVVKEVLPPLPEHHQQPAPARQPQARPVQRAAAASTADTIRPQPAKTEPTETSVVMYSSVRAPETPTPAPAQAAEPERKSVVPKNWRLVGVPTRSLALIAVPGQGGQDIRPVQVGQKLPDGSVVESIDQTAGHIVTSAGIVPISH